MPVNNEGLAYRIARGYKDVGDAIEIGSVVIAGKAYPECRVRIPLESLCKHGGLFGATGEGKTTDVAVIAGQCSDAGVPVVIADMKGDLQGLAQEGLKTSAVIDRCIATGCDSWTPQSYPVEFASLGDGVGIPVRASVESFGAVLLAKVLNLNPTQESVLKLVFSEAAKPQFMVGRSEEPQRLPLDTLENLRDAVAEISQRDDDEVGFVSKATASVLMREIKNLENEGGESFFGVPSFDPADLMRVTEDGRGIITLFEAKNQTTEPALFAVFMMWMLVKLAEIMPEVGAIDKPKLLVVLDEAHLLFDDASKTFRNLMVANIRLVRSRGLGIFFATQASRSIPEDVTDQLGCKIHHALRGYGRTLTHGASLFRKSEVYTSLPEEILSLEPGEAMVTVLTRKGYAPVARTKIRPPTSHIGVIGFNAVRRVVQDSELLEKYQAVMKDDRESLDDINDAPVITLGLPPRKTLTFHELLAMADPGYRKDTE